MRRNIDITFLILIAVLAMNSLRGGAFSDPMSWLMDKLMLIPAVLIAICFRQYAQALVAFKMGDPTPKMHGRVTINPLAHVDWIGFAALLLCGFGWGRPVEINPTNFRDMRKGMILYYVSGIAMNLIIAIAFAVIARILVMTLGLAFLSGSLGSSLWIMIMYIIQINLVLMIFNLIPCPPLDGFSIISEIFDIKTTDFYWTLCRYGNWILIALIIFGVAGMIISPMVTFLFSLLQNLIIF